MIRVALLILLAALPAQAFDIDYARVFELHADDVVQAGPSTRQLTLGTVTVLETVDSDGTRRYTGIDDSEYGAEGCLFRILVEATVIVRACEGLLDSDQQLNLAANLTRSAVFVATNTVPPVPSDEITERLEAVIDRGAERFRHFGAVCPEADPGNPGSAAFVRMLASPRTAANMARSQSVPRLPVTSPCM